MTQENQKPELHKIVSISQGGGGYGGVKLDCGHYISLSNNGAAGYGKPTDAIPWNEKNQASLPELKKGMEIACPFCRLGIPKTPLAYHDISRNTKEPIDG